MDGKRYAGNDEMTTSIEDHAAMRLSGRLVVPPECLCDEYASVIVEQAAEIKRLNEKIAWIKTLVWEKPCQDPKSP